MVGRAPSSNRTVRHRLLTASSVFTIAVVLTLGTVPQFKPALAQHSSVRSETLPFKANGEIKIENRSGSTRVDTWDEEAVQIVAQKKAPVGAGIDPSELIFMGAATTLVIQCRQKSPSDRIDIQLYVPRRTHLQVTGGIWPVEAGGFLGSAVIETTNGNIGYKVPVSDGARVAAHSSRGTVRSTMALNVYDRTGIRSLQGRYGNGTVPVILNSEGGNITLLPGTNATFANVRDESIVPGHDTQRQSRPDSGGSRDSLGARRADEQEETFDRPVFGSKAPRQRSVYGNDDDLDPNSIALPPSQRGQRGATGSSGNNSIVLAQQDSTTDDDTSARGGPFSRSRNQNENSRSNTGLSVKIIPAETPAGAPQRRRPNPVFEEAQPDDDAVRTSRPQVGRPADRTYEPPAPAGAEDVGRPDLDIPQNSRPAVPPVLRRSGSDEDASSAVPAAARSSTDEEVLKLEAALVNLNVSVTDRSGKALGDLRREDFEVIENSDPQSIQFFASTSAPFNLVLLLDLSGSVREKLNVVKSSALKFIDVIGPQDRVAVVTFTREVSVISQLTADRDLLKRRIKEIEVADGGTAFYEALWFALVDTLKGTKGQRNAVVIMSDGVDNALDRMNPLHSRVSFDRLTRFVEESDTILFPIYLDTEYEEVFKPQGRASSESYAIARFQLERLAETSGGQLFRAQEVKDLAGAYQQVAAALRTVYSVGYQPTNPERDGTFRRVRVRVNRSEAVVRARKGYYAR